MFVDGPLLCTYIFYILQYLLGSSIIVSFHIWHHFLLLVFVVFPLTSSCVFCHMLVLYLGIKDLVPIWQINACFPRIYARCNIFRCHMWLGNVFSPAPCRGCWKSTWDHTKLVQGTLAYPKLSWSSIILYSHVHSYRCPLIWCLLGGTCWKIFLQLFGCT